jgi:hypothetical protein
MSGPSWLIGKGTKWLLTAAGADPLSATIVARTVHVASSCVFHDHHTHFHPYGDELSDAHSLITDNGVCDNSYDYNDNNQHHNNSHSQRSGSSGNELVYTDQYGQTWKVEPTGNTSNSMIEVKNPHPCGTTTGGPNWKSDNNEHVEKAWVSIDSLGNKK